MKRKMFILLSIILFMFTLSFFACGNDQKEKDTTNSNGKDTNQKVKIGFLVKQPEESWFQDEWKFAQEAADDLKFELIKIGATDGEKVLSAIDNLASQGAKGFVICTPDVKLGPAIVQKAKSYNLKLMSVDDRFLGSDGQPIESVHHMGISAYNIGKLVGTTLVEKIKEKGWNLSEVGFLRMSYDSLPTIKERTDGATDSLLEKLDFPKENIFDSPMKTLDTEGSFNAANISITKNPNIKHWIIAGGNDASVIGAVRATESNNFKAADVVGVGINGSNFAINEFEKSEVTGFYATVKLSAKRHGYETSTNMYHWIVDNKEPDKLIYTTGQLMTRQNYKDL